MTFYPFFLTYSFKTENDYIVEQQTFWASFLWNVGGSFQFFCPQRTRWKTLIFRNVRFKILSLDLGHIFCIFHLTAAKSVILRKI